MLVLLLWSVAVAAVAGPAQPAGQSIGRGGAVRQAVEAAHDAPPGQRHQPDGLDLPGLPADAVAGLDVEPHPPGFGSIEDKAAIDLEKRVVRADPDGVI